MSSNTDHERFATSDDLLRALQSLDVMARRKTVDPELEFAAFRVALEGGRPGQTVVAAIDLANAVRLCFQNGLGHSFHPSPAELRALCDRSRSARLEALRAQAEAIERRQRIAAQIADRHVPERPQGERERVAKLMREFNMRWEIERTKEPPLDEVRARYSDDTLRRLPNQPTASEAWRRYETRLALEAARAAQGRPDHHTGG